MSKDGVQVNKRTTLLITAAAFLASFMGFGWLLLSLHHEGLKTHTERLYYLPYQLVQAEQAKLDQARVPIKLKSREIEPGIYEHTLEIQSSVGERIAQMSELGLELLSPADWKLISADVTFQGNEGTEKTPGFATTERKKQGTISSILLNAVAGDSKKPKSGPIKGVLTIKCTGSSELSVWVQKTSVKPVSPILWTSVPNTEGDPVYASLSGWFRYSEEGVPDYSKAQLLAYTWGMGVAGNRVIYTLVGVAFLLWIAGMGMLLVPDLMKKVIPRFLTEAIGYSMILGVICLIFSFIFPPFHGPDETNHFFTYTKIAGKESLESGALELANKSCFQRIHRREDNKFVSRDALETRNEEWPPYGEGPYPLYRSPLERVCWIALSHIMPHENAALVMLQLRVVNGLFVASCLLLALAVTGSIFPTRHLASWFSAPVLLIPCIAHYSTVVSNYPFLIGGYVIQMVVLGILWASLDSRSLLSRDLAKIGALLGIGMGIALCSADNAMATLPFWGVVLPVWFMGLGLSSKGSPSGVSLCSSFYGFAAAGLFLICIPVGLMTSQHAFLPEMGMNRLINAIPVHGNSFAAGVLFLTAYLTTVGAASLLTFHAGRMMHGRDLGIPWRNLGVAALIAGILLAAFHFQPEVPEIGFTGGGHTTVLKYALSITGAFFDGLLPGKVDFFAVESFWRNLGWLDTRLPCYEMEILRIAMGVGIVLLVWTSLKRKDSGEKALFAAGSLVALASCLATITVLYYIVLYNVNSRYILVAYLFGAGLAMEGYRRFFESSPGREVTGIPSAATICTLAIIFQSWAWVTIVNRYF